MSAGPEGCGLLSSFSVHAAVESRKVYLSLDVTVEDRTGEPKETGGRVLN